MAILIVNALYFLEHQDRSHKGYQNSPNQGKVAHVSEAKFGELQLTLVNAFHAAKQGLPTVSIAFPAMYRDRVIDRRENNDD